MWGERPTVLTEQRAVVFPESEQPRPSNTASQAHRGAGLPGVKYFLPMLYPHSQGRTTEVTAFPTLSAASAPSHLLFCVPGSSPPSGQRSPTLREAPTIDLGSPSRSTLHQLSETQSPAWLPPPTPGIGLSPIPGTKHTSFQQQESTCLWKSDSRPGHDASAQQPSLGFGPRLSFFSHLGRTEWSLWGFPKPHGALRVLVVRPLGGRSQSNRGLLTPASHTKQNTTKAHFNPTDLKVDSV